jgi:hypothetical protein
MQKKVYVAMACMVGNYGQSDDLYLMKRRDGTIVGYSGEFELLTGDIRVACTFDPSDMKGSIERSLAAHWFGLPEDELRGLVPATLDEIKTLNLEDLVIGSKVDMRVKTPIDPLDLQSKTGQ